MITKSFNEIENDKLERIFELQKDLNDRIIKERDIDLCFDEWIRQWCLAIFSETNEILDEINWKHWKNYRHIDNEAVKEEIADVLHFVVSLALTCGMTADDLFERYTSKNGENHERQDGTVEGREDYKAWIKELTVPTQGDFIQ